MKIHWLGFKKLNLLCHHDVLLNSSLLQCHTCRIPSREEGSAGETEEQPSFLQ
jgi:hypothetical protein